MLASLLFGSYRQHVLGLLLLHPERSYYVREIARLTDKPAGTLHKELAHLAQAGLLIRETVGNQVRYSANRNCPVFEELASILRKTSGLVDVLAKALSSVAEHLSLAFVFGSVARGEQQENSDVDIMLVGSVSFGKAVEVLYPAQEVLQREINPAVYTVAEFSHSVLNNSFIREVLDKPKLFIIGSEDELRKFTKNK